MLIALPSYYRVLSGAFTPLNLFVGGRQGGWWDPSDLDSLWVDQAKTQTPVDGDPVWWLDDKSGNGLHQQALNSAARGIWRGGDGRGDVNQLYYTTTFTQGGDTGWNFNGFDILATGLPDAFGGNTAIRVQENGTSGNPFIKSNRDASASQETFSVYLRSATHTTPVEVHTQGSSRNANPVALTTSWVRRTATQSTGSGDSAHIGGWGHLNGTGVIMEVCGPQQELGATASDYQANGSHLGGIHTGLDSDIGWIEGTATNHYTSAPRPSGVTTQILAAFQHDSGDNMMVRSSVTDSLMLVSQNVTNEVHRHITPQFPDVRVNGASIGAITQRDQFEPYVDNSTLVVTLGAFTYDAGQGFVTNNHRHFAYSNGTGYPLLGRYYGEIEVAASLTQAEIDNAEAWLAAKSVVTLP